MKRAILSLAQYVVFGDTAGHHVEQNGNRKGDAHTESNVTL